MKNKFSSSISFFMKEVERYFTPIMTRIGENRYMLAIRNGIVSTIPLILVGSIFMIIASFPVSGTETVNNLLAKQGLTDWQTFLWLPFRLTMYIMGLFAVYGVTKSLAEHYKLDSIQVCFVSVVIYLASIVGPTYTPPGGPSVAFARLGAASIFGAIIISFLATELFRVCVKYNLTIRLPKQVPPAVSKSFAAFTPLLLGTTIGVLLFAVLKFDIHNFIMTTFSPLQSFFAGNNIGGMIITILLVTLLWTAGIHGVSIIGALARPFWLLAIDKNQALADGGILYATTDGSAILVEPVYQWFIWIGGSGATIGLIISMLIVGKSRYGKSITRSSAIPGIFNINEPVIFGFPIVLNPVLILPFILAPLTMGIVSFLVLQAGLVALPIATAAWTLPSPIGAFFATLDWKSVILNICLIALATAIWLPFAKIYDKQLLKSEIEMMSDEEKEFLNKLSKKVSIKFIHLSDEARVEILKKDETEIKELLSNKKQLKEFSKSVEAIE